MRRNIQYKFLRLQEPNPHYLTGIRKAMYFFDYAKYWGLSESLDYLNMVNENRKNRNK
jgi:hypothetical protein